MSERDTFVAELSQKLLGSILAGAFAAGKAVDPIETADLAVLAACALYDKLSKPIP